MISMIITFGGIAICAILFLIWMKFTPSGKKWLENL